MPNWCHNHVIISLYDMSHKERKKFRKEIGISMGDDAEFSFQNILPCPQELRDHSSGSFCTEEEYADQEPCKFDGSLRMTKKMAKEFLEKFGAKDWYNWCNNNWGTKWDPDITDFNQNEEDTIEVTFDTAWGPAEGIYTYLLETYPKLSISWFYNEPGMEFAGYLPD